MSKNPDEETKYWQIGGAVIGTVLGAGLGCIASYVFFPKIISWLQQKGLTDGYKYLIGALIVLLSMPIPGLIGYVGGGDKSTILSNSAYFLILYFTLIMMFEDLMLPNLFDSLILAAIFFFCILLSTKFGLKVDGTLSGFWIPIIIVFALLIAIYYNFANISKAIKNVEELWDDYGSTKDTTKDDDKSTKDEAKTTKDDTTKAETKAAPRKRWLSIDYTEYKKLAEKLIETINPVSHPELESPVEKGEHAINVNLQKARFMMIAAIALIMLVIFGLSMLIGILIRLFGGKTNGTPSLSSNLSSGLEITDILIISFCIFLFIIKKVIDVYLAKYPQFKPENLEPLVDTVSKNWDPSKIASLVPNELKNAVQTGGGKISSYKPRKSKTSEKYLRVAF